jgi:hypothetical protein
LQNYSFVTSYARRFQLGCTAIAEASFCFKLNIGGIGKLTPVEARTLAKKSFDQIANGFRPGGDQDGGT